MVILEKNLSMEEQCIVNVWKDDRLEVLDRIEEECYILSMNGNIKFSECFGLPPNNFEAKQRYVIAVPNKIIKYYHYYLLENRGEEGKWYVGEKYKNGNIEFYKCCENLEEAFESI